MSYPPDIVRKLKHWGVPMVCEPLESPAESLVDDFVTAAVYTRTDPTFMRVLPVGIWKNRESLTSECDPLFGQVYSKEERRAYAFMLDLTASVAQSILCADWGNLKYMATVVHPEALPKNTEQYFAHDRIRKPFPLAALYGYHMNMSFECIASQFRKFIKE